MMRSLYFSLDPLFDLLSLLGVISGVPSGVINRATIMYPSLTEDAPEVVRRMHDVTLGGYHRSVAWHGIGSSSMIRTSHATIAKPASIVVGQVSGAGDSRK
jgi:hypothetical protein